MYNSTTNFLEIAHSFWENNLVICAINTIAVPR